jgi:opacity protein-like surface antigen
MKNPLISRIAMMTMGLAGCVALQAQNAESKWYFRGDLGASLAMETDVKQFLGPVSGAEVDFDPGLRLGVAGGYRITPWLAVELESGALFNSVNELSGESIDASLMQLPFMGNLVVQCNNFDRLVPFIGLGAGGVSSIFDIDERFAGSGGTLRIEGTDADLVFGYHAFAGLRYEFNDRMGVGLIYRFMGTQGASWEVEDAFGADDLEIELDDLFTHSISVVFQLHF